MGRQYDFARRLEDGMLMLGGEEPDDGDEMTVDGEPLGEGFHVLDMDE